MAFEIVNPAAGIWLARGLRYLLMPEDLAESRQSVQTARIPERKAQGGRLPRPAPERPKAQSPAPEPRRKPEWKPLPESSWPAIWREQFGHTKRGRIVWTYANIGKDLLAGRNPDSAESVESAQARARRSQMLRKLLGALKYPAGTHTFWPCQLEESLEPEIFWSGVRALGSRGVIILGEDCATALLGSKASPFTSPIFRGHRAIVLRALEDYSDQDHESIVSFLRSILAQVVR